MSTVFVVGEQINATQGQMATALTNAQAALDATDGLEDYSFGESSFVCGNLVSLGTTDDPFSDIFLRPSSSLTPTSDGDLCIEATSDTAITIKYKDSSSTQRELELGMLTAKQEWSTSTGTLVELATILENLGLLEIVA